MGCGRVVTGIATGGLSEVVPYVTGQKSAEAMADATRAAADASATGTAAQIASNERMYNQNREDFAPFRNLAPRSLAELQSTVYGGPMTYIGPDGKEIQIQGNQFDLANFKPENTAAFDWQKSRTLEDLGNYFNLVGRGRGSTVQSNATARSLGDLNAKEYETGYNRLFQRKQDYTNDLLNLVKTAQGAAGTTASLGAATAANNAQAIGQNASNQANAALAQGQTQANMYQGISQLPFQAGSLAMMGGWKPFA